VRLKHYSASDAQAPGPGGFGQYIRITHMGNGKAGPNHKFAITPTWQQICMRAYEGYAVEEGTKDNKKVCKFFIIQKWTPAAHGSQGEIYNIGCGLGECESEPAYWHEGDEIELAYPACYMPTLETGLSPVNMWVEGELDKYAPSIASYDYLNTSPSGGYNFGPLNVSLDHNDIDFLTWNEDNVGWADVGPTLLNKWVTTFVKYTFNGGGYNIPGTRGRPAGPGGGAGGSPGSDDPDSALGGTATLLLKEDGHTLDPAGIRHDLILESQKDYKLTVFIAKQGQHYEPENNNARQVVSLIEFAFSKHYPISVGSKIDSGEPDVHGHLTGRGNPDPPVLPLISYHRLWINWDKNANKVDNVFSETHNTNVNGYEIEDMGSTGWYKVSLDLTIDPSGFFRNDPEGCKGMITVYPSRNYSKNGIDYSRSIQDPEHGRPTIRRGRVSIGRTYLTDTTYSIPDDYTAYGELFEWSYVKRNTNYKTWEGPYINSYDPSTAVLKNFVKLYKGQSLNTLDAINVIEEYVWKNYYGTGNPYNLADSLNSLVVDPNFGKVRGVKDIDHTVIPQTYLSGTGQYTSGDQNLTNLQTLNDVIYSPLYMDRDDTKVSHALNTYFTLGKLVDDETPLGPLHRFLQALGFISFDINNQVESIRTLTSIQECPTSLLPYLASIIGWKLYGKNTDSWRRQLWNATELYKKKGSLGGLEHAMDVVFPVNPLLFKGELDPVIAYNFLSDIDFLDVGLYAGINDPNFLVTNYTNYVYGAWANKDNLLKRITHRTPAPYGDEDVADFWAKDFFVTEQDIEEGDQSGDDSYLVQDYLLNNNEIYTFSVFLKYVPYRDETHHSQASLISIKYPSVGPTYSETHFGVKWITEGAFEGHVLMMEVVRTILIVLQGGTALMKSVYPQAVCMGVWIQGQKTIANYAHVMMEVVIMEEESAMLTKIVQRVKHVLMAFVRMMGVRVVWTIWIVHV
jgi:phage tail-like protein